jgi:hypothetical protein
MGLSLLEQLDVLTDVNRRNYAAYQAELRDAPGVRLLTHDPAGAAADLAEAALDRIGNRHDARGVHPRR